MIQHGPSPLSSPASSQQGGAIRIHIAQFRSYPALSLSMDTRSVALAGPNGVGKTNLLEALSLLGPGRGLRHAALKDMSTYGQTHPKPWSVFAELQSSIGHQTLTVATRLDPQSLSDHQERRQLYLEGQPLSPQSDILHHLWIVSLTPQMDGIFRESPQGRRRFLDHIISGLDPQHTHRLMQYAHHLKERNSLLKQRTYDPLWLDTIEAKIAPLGVAIAAQRVETLQRLHHHMSQGDHPFPQPELACEGLLEQHLQNQPSLDVEEFFQKQLALNRPQDRESGQCSIGPHRTDILVMHSKHRHPAHLCSTGEQKALLIRWLLAAVELYQQHRTGIPLLLLDEVMAHLDAQRRIDFFEEIDRLKIQSWMTGTDVSFFTPFGSKLQCFDLVSLKSA